MAHGREDQHPLGRHFLAGVAESYGGLGFAAHYGISILGLFGKMKLLTTNSRCHKLQMQLRATGFRCQTFLSLSTAPPGPRSCAYLWSGSGAVPSVGRDSLGSSYDPRDC